MAYVLVYNLIHMLQRSTSVKFEMYRIAHTICYGLLFVWLLERNVFGYSLSLLGNISFVDSLFKFEQMCRCLAKRLFVLGTFLPLALRLACLLVIFQFLVVI